MNWTWIPLGRSREKKRCRDLAQGLDRTFLACKMRVAGLVPQEPRRISEIMERNSALVVVQVGLGGR